MVFAMDVRFRHSFHEIESLDIPNILFPSQCRKLYQVIGIGIQEEFRNPYVIIKEQHGSVTFRLPEELSTWVQNKFYWRFLLLKAKFISGIADVQNFV
ncbi:TPA: hypothetical protein QCN45_001334 [Bacillus cereus]|uniref:hypothetical protein n=1 Tax=Bacillus cereus TaxID=1396 RepID=UPI00330ED270|nr:hypothetical protein [Bacillus cereus]